ncbi:MAG: hypothetical protein ACFE9L_01250 [Candidatus Hodarchaeota archaeon]
MEALAPRDPKKEVSKKIILGISLSLVLIVLYAIISGNSISPEIFGLAFFFMGGIYLVVGGIRDIFGSFLIKMLKGEIESTLESEEAHYFYGFGKAGEDVVAGVFLVFLAFVNWTIMI